MRLTRFAVFNHARIADVDVDVRRHAVVVGANDVGKASILRILNLLLGASTGQMYQQLTLADLRDPDAEMTVDARLAGFDDTDRAVFTSAIDIDATDHAESLLIRLKVAGDPGRLGSSQGPSLLPRVGSPPRTLARAIDGARLALPSGDTWRIGGRRRRAVQRAAGPA